MLTGGEEEPEPLTLVFEGELVPRATGLALGQKVDLVGDLHVQYVVDDDGYPVTTTSIFRVIRFQDKPPELVGE